MIWPTVDFDPERLFGDRHERAVGLGDRRAADHDFIALETTGDLWLTTAVLIAAIFPCR